jgi:hypothetical protein
VGLDDRTDVYQLASVSLSLLLGRRMTPMEHAVKLDVLLDEFANSPEGRSSSFTPALRLWLERALRTDGRGFSSARDACEGIHALSHAPKPDLLQLKARPDGAVFGGSGDPSEPSALGGRAAHWLRQPIVQVRRVATSRPLAAGLAAVVVLQAIVIATLLARQQPNAVPALVPVRIESQQAGDIVMVDGEAVGLTPLDLTVGSSMRTISVVSAASSPVAAAGLPIDPALSVRVPALSSTPAANLATAGAVPPVPGGRVSINAVPWAQVWIDGKQVGETPIAHFPMSAGEHEVIFRHPELGEHRETLVVQSGGEARISATFNQ